MAKTMTVTARSMMDSPEACEEQQGVCAGSVKTCGGALGWLACDDAAYGADYEATEATCDDLDNDCDGQIDEGLGGAACDDNGDGCAEGTLECSDGAEVCVGDVCPAGESCDGVSCVPDS